MTNIPPPFVHQPYGIPPPAGAKLWGLALAGTIVAAVALMLAFIPFCGMTAIPVAVIGIILAVVGLVGAKSGTGKDFILPGAGVLVGLLALAIGIYQFKRVSDAVVEGTKTLDSALTTFSTATNQQIVPPASGVAAAPAADGSVSAIYAVRQGNLQVRVVSVVADPALDTAPDPEAYSSDSWKGALLVTLELTNVGGTGAAAIPYQTWCTGEQRNGVMPGPNTSGILYVGGTRAKYVVVSSIPRLTISEVSAGKSVREVLTYQIPAPEAGSLKLELPARNFQGTGYLRFFIPEKMVVRK